MVLEKLICTNLKTEGDYGSGWTMLRYVLSYIAVVPTIKDQSSIDPSILKIDLY